MTDVIKATTARNKTLGKLEWRILIVDKQSMKMVSACIKMHELSIEGITSIELIEKRREPLATMEAIYLIVPNESSITELISDFQSQPNYSTAHVYFTETCPDKLFDKLSKSNVTKYVTTLKQINMSFLPIEKQVYSLDKPEFFQSFYSSMQSSENSSELEKIAEQLATLCFTLGEYPSIRYKSNEKNAKLAHRVRQKLDLLKNDEPIFEEVSDKAKSQLLILDRSIDTVTCLVHELTYQAMSYDLHDIKNDVYCYENSEGQKKEAVLDENDDLWVETRHQHIAVVSQNIPKKFKKLHQEKLMCKSGTPNIRYLTEMIKKMPQQQKELANYSVHLALAEENMKKYVGYVDKLCKVEQDLVMGTNGEGERIRDHMRNIVPILLDQNVKPKDKIRIILLYILSKNGISEENILKLIQHAQIPQEERAMITNIAILGQNIEEHKISDTSNLKNDINQSSTYVNSRWSPLLKNIIQGALEEKLDKTEYPVLPRQKLPKTNESKHCSNRFGTLHKEKAKEISPKHVPRLIVFIMGGATYSELRTGYEITDERKNWEIIIGGSQILTPELFLENIKKLS